MGNRNNRKLTTRGQLRQIRVEGYNTALTTDDPTERDLALERAEAAGLGALGLDALRRLSPDTQSRIVGDSQDRLAAIDERYGRAIVPAIGDAALAPQDDPTNIEYWKDMLPESATDAGQAA